MPQGEFRPPPWGVPAATSTFSASSAGQKCTFPPRRLRDSGQPSCSAQVTHVLVVGPRQAPGNGQASSRRDQAGPYVPHPGLGTGHCKVSSQAGAPLPRRPASSPGNWSGRQDLGLPSRPPGSEILGYSPRACCPALCGLKFGFQSSKEKGLAWALCSCCY